MTTRPPSQSTAAAILVAGLMSTGCANTLQTPSRASLAIDHGPELSLLPVLRGSTELEKQAAISHRDDDGESAAVPALFWTGMIVGVAGSASAIGFGAAARATENDIRDGFNGGFTQTEANDLENRGNRLNSLTAGAAAIGVVGLTVAAIAYGIDYSRCGSLGLKNRRRNCPSPYTRETAP